MRKSAKERGLTMTTTMHVFLATALGSFVGALVALQLGQFAWWFGSLVGAAIGYISYQPLVIVSAIPRSLAKATSKRALVRWRAFRRSWVGYTAIMSSLAFVVLLPATLMVLFGGEVYHHIGFGVGGATLFVCILIPLISATDSAMQKRSGLSKRDWGLSEYHFINVYFRWFPQWLARVIPLTISAAPGLAIKIGSWVFRTAAASTSWCLRFTWYLFTEIHSNIQLLCGVDAAIGAAVGYFLENAALGAVMGGLFGVVNYEIVSKRWLKLVPARR